MKKSMRKTGSKYPFANRFLTGMIIALAATLTAFEWTTVTSTPIIPTYEYADNDDDEVLPPVTFPAEKLKKPSPKTNSLVFNVVKKLADPTPEPKPDPNPAEPTTNSDPLKDFNDLIDQLGDDDNYEDNTIYESVQVFAHYDNCSSFYGKELKDCSELDLVTRIRDNFRITSQLREIGGRQAAHISFIIDKEGNVGSFEVLGTSSKAMSRAAIKAIKKLPKMNPAQQQGRDVALKVKIPITVEIKG